MQGRPRRNSGGQQDGEGRQNAAPHWGCATSTISKTDAPMGPP